MEDMMLPAIGAGWVVALVTVLAVALAWVLVRVFWRALSYRPNGEFQVDRDIHNFDYIESHRLLMEREDIVQMTQQGYYDPRDQLFSLERWKQKVANYIESYRCYVQKADSDKFSR